jgi:predicted ATPase
MTRLAGTIAQDSTDRMFQVELSTVARAGDVAEAIATGIGAGLTDATPVQAILGTLRNRRAILMIDNAEHVVRAVSALLHTILTECPDISMLVTSRVSRGKGVSAATAAAAAGWRPAFGRGGTEL